jgi:hypothetical protein
MTEDLNRDQAEAAGLRVGDCEWCGYAIWSDRDPNYAHSPGSYAWHRECAEDCLETLNRALS